MITIIMLFSALMIIAGIVLMIKPRVIFSTLGDHQDELALYIAAIIVRVILGGLLITQSGVTKYPVIVEFLGWISIIAAVVLLAMGRKKFAELIAWVLTKTNSLSFLGGVIAIGFGVFILYAFSNIF